MLPFLVEAGKVALGRDPRNFLLGSIGIRKDGAIVAAKNGAVISSTYDDYRVISDAHAEMRCLKKMRKGGVIYTARILKKDGSFAMARPCFSCSQRLRMARIEKAFYTIDNNHYGIYYPLLDMDKIYEV